MSDFPPLDTKPMEAEPVDDLPTGPGYLYEQKYDGFRCLGFRTRDQVHLQSKNQKPLGRYFPEVESALAEIEETGFVLDGEIISPEGFETLQLRLHPAESRVRRMAEEHPAQYVVFDILARHGKPLLSETLADRRAVLEDFIRTHGGPAVLQLGKKATTAATARKWIGQQGLDGVMVKEVTLTYQPGKRAMQKYKVWQTVDCVLGGSI